MPGTVFSRSPNEAGAALRSTPDSRAPSAVIAAPT